MAILSKLIIYPIKSCAGIPVPEATLTRAGLALDGVRDREWMVVDGDGIFLSQRAHPRMALITPRLREGALELGAPGMPALAIALAAHATGGAPPREVRVWDDVVLADNCGDAAAAWFSQMLGVACRLVRFNAAAARLASAKWTGGVDAPTRFADGYPVLVAGTASLADVNQKLAAAGRAALPMDRFRPNLVVDGIGAFEEDYVDTFGLGAALLKPVKPCGRCPMPSIDQATGERGPDPLDIMQAYRRKAQVGDEICFGMNAIVVEGEGERLFVGQAVSVALAF
ncbi:MOSC domain-containing protein [Massilia glaciei]|uniref:MOSC domain-containing protein n=1 Tax=Massilia glaciei TaxID=1524097 RepID=A0A2U2I7S6_9BURK|nr:MOSC N-terminal beta barrel domain-containing protein [Massilia glaciei]PWF55775.1 MOSC domain-containing protein [Massilia glaciei]